MLIFSLILFLWIAIGSCVAIGMLRFCGPPPAHAPDHVSPKQFVTMVILFWPALVIAIAAMLPVVLLLATGTLIGWLGEVVIYNSWQYIGPAISWPFVKFLDIILWLGGQHEHGNGVQGNGVRPNP